MDNLWRDFGDPAHLSKAPRTGAFSPRRASARNPLYCLDATRPPASIHPPFYQRLKPILSSFTFIAQRKSRIPADFTIYCAIMQTVSRDVGCAILS
jgi:hypothetical protein